MAKVQNYKSVDDYIKNCNHPLKETVIYLRKLFATAHKDIGEHIKWNSPAYFYNGEVKKSDAKEYKQDLVVFNLIKPDYILLVFPSANHLAVSPSLKDENLKDGRKMLKIVNQQDAEDKRDALEKLILEWIKTRDFN
jgi:Domain of unknown function (DU1801)